MISILLLSLISSWGYSGHFAIGNLTMKLLPDDILSKVTSMLLNDTSDTAVGRIYAGSLGRASTWPDYIKRYADFQWSKSIHYVDTNDNPPDTCAYLINDCSGDGPYSCLISAINHFYTHLGQDIAPILNSGPVSTLTAVQGLKFFVHLVQDLHQPLHVCGRERGGNGMKVRFGRKRTNLHSVWDSLMINKRIKDDFKNRRQDWINSLFEKTTLFTDICLSDCQKVQCTIDSETCLQNWTSWINKLNCKTTWQLDDDALGLNMHEQFNIDDTVDLSGEYYKRNVKLMEDLIVTAAIRSATMMIAKFK